MKSRPGVAAGGESIKPEDLPEESADKNADPKAAPAPGIPVSDEEYKRMKDAAKHAPTPRVNHTQEDKPRKQSDDDDECATSQPARSNPEKD